MGDMDKREYANGTYLTQENSFGWYRGGAAMCPDGKVRRLKRLSLTAGSFYSVPASVEVRANGKRVTVAGFISLDHLNTISGSTLETPEEPTVIFHPYLYRKNYSVFYPKAIVHPENVYGKPGKHVVKPIKLDDVTYGDYLTSVQGEGIYYVTSNTYSPYIGESRVTVAVVHSPTTSMIGVKDYPVRLNEFVQAWRVVGTVEK